MSDEQETKGLNLKPLIIWGVIVICLLVGGMGCLWNKSISEKNEIERMKIETERQAQEDKRQAEIDASEAALKAENIRQANITSCIYMAEKTYDQNWNSSCKTFYNENERKYTNCVETALKYEVKSIDGVPVKEFCRSMTPKLPLTDCTLPRATADRWDEELKNAKDACYKRYD